MEYSEHDGVNRQLEGNTGEIMYRYSFTKAIIKVFIARTPFRPQTSCNYSGPCSACQPFPALCPSVLQHLSAPAGAHPGKKAVGLFPSAVMRVKCRICSHNKYPPLKILNTNYKFPSTVMSTRTTIVGSGPVCFCSVSISRSIQSLACIEHYLWSPLLYMWARRYSPTIDNPGDTEQKQTGPLPK